MSTRADELWALGPTYLRSQPTNYREPHSRDLRRLKEYKQVITLEYILFIEPNAPVVMQWLRDEQRDWQMCLVDGPGQEIAMPALRVTLAIDQIYEGITFPASPSFASRS